MSYVTGTCNSFADIKNNLISECVNAGWTHTTDSGGYDVIYKGSLYLRIIVYAGKVTFRAQTDIAGTSAHPYFVAISNFTKDYAGIGYVTFPGTYHFFSFTNPDEVYFIYNYEDKYQFVAFGQSNMASLLPGTGMWVTATDGYGNTGQQDFQNYPQNISLGYPYDDDTTASPFWSDRYSVYSNIKAHPCNTWLHSNIDTNYPWSMGKTDFDASTDGTGVVGVRYLETVTTQPWLNRSLLIPFKLYKRSSVYNYKAHLTAEIQYSRYYDIRYIEPEDVISNGTEQWKVFPFFRKGNGGNDDTGYRGWAIRIA